MELVDNNRYYDYWTVELYIKLRKCALLDLAVNFYKNTVASDKYANVLTGSDWLPHVDDL